MAGGVITTGGLTALVGKMFHAKKGTKKENGFETIELKGE